MQKRAYLNKLSEEKKNNHFDAEYYEQNTVFKNHFIYNNLSR